VTPIAGSRPFKGSGHPFGAARFQHGQRIGSPILLVEIGGKKPTGLVRKQRINARDEVIARGAQAVAAAQVLFDYVVGDRDEGLMRALPAFDLGLTAYSPDPLVGARGRIAGLGGLPVFPSDREYVRATCEQAPKQRHLVGAGGRRRDSRCISDGYRLMIDLRQRRSLAQKIGERCLEFHPFGSELGNSGADTLDFFINFATVHKVTGAHVSTSPE
jgi:hypothetical protein